MHRAVSDPPCLLCINYLGRETPFPPSGVLACLESLCPGRGSGCNAQEMFFQIPFVAPDPLHHSAWCLLTASCVRAGNAASAEQGAPGGCEVASLGDLWPSHVLRCLWVSPQHSTGQVPSSVWLQSVSAAFFFHAGRVWEIKACHRSPSCTVWSQLLVLYKGWVLLWPPSLRLDLTSQTAALCQANFWAAAPVPCCHY